MDNCKNKTIFEIISKYVESFGSIWLAGCERPLEILLNYFAKVIRSIEERKYVGIKLLGVLWKFKKKTIGKEMWRILGMLQKLKMDQLIKIK